MPRWDFVCSKCGERLEDVVLPTADTFPGYCRCSIGGKTTLVRQPSAPAFHLKGAGFYKNDYGKKEDRTDG
jgi:putative regulatory protein, FmdB family